MIGPNRLAADPARRVGLALGLFQFSVQMRLTGLEGVIESEGESVSGTVSSELFGILHARMKA